MQLLEFFGLVVLYDLVFKESFLKPLVVRFTQNNLRRNLPWVMEYIDGEMIKAVKTDSIPAVIDDIKSGDFLEGLGESAKKEMLSIAMAEFNPLIFLEKLNDKTRIPK